jgi:alkaline phosphatase D
MGTIVGRTLMPEETPGWVRPGTGDSTVNKFKRDVRASKLGLPMWMDRWDGYPAARSRLLKSAQQADADLVVLSGDSHNAWAYSLEEDGQPAGIEFACHAVTSNGIEGQLGEDPKNIAAAFIAANPELAWGDTSQRGYMMIDLTSERVTGEWLFMRTVKSRSTALAGVHRMSAERGRRKIPV